MQVNQLRRRVRASIKRAGITPTEFARQAGVSPAWISMFLAGKRGENARHHVITAVRKTCERLSNGDAP